MRLSNSLLIRAGWLVLLVAQTGWAVPADGINVVTRNASTSQTSLILARDGKAALPIVISEKASKGTQAVAVELADYLERISGAKFEITTGSGDTGIVLGTLTEFPQPELAEALKLNGAFDGREAFAIRTQPKRLLLIGATDLGVSHAAFRLLDELGCRWLFPAKNWEVIPKQTTLQFNRDITDRPAILSRVIWFEAGSGGAVQNAEYAAWKRHNLQGESFVVNAGHNLDTIIRVNQAEFDKHPEYYALVDGKRKGPQLELANPAVRKMVVDYTLDFFKHNPVADMVSLDPADTPQHSTSPESLALGSVSDRVFAMANEAARAVQREYPGKMVGLYSYSAHWDPPSFKLEPNVHVLLAGVGQGQLTPAERTALWPQRSSNLGFYEYFSVWLWSYDRLPGSWTNDIHGTQRRMQEIVRSGGTSVSAESTSSWGSNGRGYYIANKLLWNPDLDVEALAQDFYATAFGPGAAAMQRYYERLDPGNKPFLSKHLLGKCYRDIAEASALAKDRPDVQARLDDLKLYLRYVHLDWQRNREPATAVQKAELQVAIMTHLYRTRLAATTSWEMIRQQWGENKFPQDAPAPGQNSAPYSREEIDRDFQAGLAFFQPREIGEAVKFSENLVPIHWPDRPQIKSEQAYQGGAKYWLYSRHGEPLEFTTSAGNAWNGINRFTLTDPHGKEIAKGTLPNNKTTEHKIDVPAAGLYQLDYNDNGSFWSITVAPGRVATLPMGQTQDFRNSKVMQDMYFYVPRGTKKIEYYYIRTNFHPGGPHKVIDPEGKIVQEVDVNGDWVAVTVPQGMDGKLWRLREPVLGVFWFNNVPNYLAASPEALLVPREVAEKDELKIEN